MAHASNSTTLQPTSQTISSGETTTAKSIMRMIAKKLFNAQEIQGVRICSQPQATSKMHTNLTRCAKNMIIAMRQLACIHVEPSSPSIKINGRLLINTLKQFKQPLAKFRHILWQSENVGLITIDWNGRQGKSNYRFFPDTLNWQKNTNFRCIFTTETQETIFSKQCQRIEIDLQQELFILLPERNKSLIKFQNWISTLGSMDALLKLKKIFKF